MANIQIFNDFLNITVTREMKYILRQAAAAQNVQISELVRRAIVAYLENLPAAPAPDEKQPRTTEIRHRSSSFEPIHSEMADIANKTLENLGGASWDSKQKK